MAKRVWKKEDARVGNMTELEATAEYEKTLNDVYKEKGFLATVGYELKSTVYSAGKRLGNALDWGVVAEGDSKYKRGDGYGAGTRGERDYMDAKYDTSRRTAERKAFILRGSKKSKGLEATTAVASILGLIGGAFFLSSNMTGNVIGLSSSSSNIIGSVLLVIGLVGCFFWVKSKKKSKVSKVSKKKSKK